MLLFKATAHSPKKHVQPKGQKKIYVPENCTPSPRNNIVR